MFQLSIYIHIKGIFKRVSHFFLLLCSFWEISNYLSPRVIVRNYIFKECLILNNLQIIRKKADTALISVYLSCPAENFKVRLYCIQDLELANYTLQPFGKTRWLLWIFLRNMMWCVIWLFMCLIFWLHLLIK